MDRVAYLIAFVLLLAACSPPAERMDWKALTDYLDQQEPAP